MKKNLFQKKWQNSDSGLFLLPLRYDFYEKAVTFRPYQVDMLDPVTANFLGDNLRCWMQIQVGKGPQASEVSGIVKIGQTMTMVLGVKDDENKFDMMVSKNLEINFFKYFNKIPDCQTAQCITVSIV